MEQQVQILKEMYSDYKSVKAFVNQFSNIITASHPCNKVWFGIKSLIFNLL